MLICLILGPADEHRSGANQMRQYLSFREHFRRGNAVSHPVRRAADDGASKCKSFTRCTAGAVQRLSTSSAFRQYMRVINTKRPRWRRELPVWPKRWGGRVSTE